MALPAAVAQADTRDDLVRQQEENAAERERVEASLEGVNSELAAAYLALEDVRTKLPVAQAALAEAQDKLAAAESKQAQVAGRLDLAEAEAAALAEEIADGGTRIDATKTAMGELARSTYRGEHAASSLSVVLDAGSTEDFLRGYAVRESAVRAQTQVLDELETAGAVARNQAERQEAVTTRIGELKADADDAVAAADEARAAAKKHATEIAQLERETTALAADLEAKKKEHGEQIDELESSNDELAKEIAAIDEANRKAEEERKRKAAAAAAAAEAERQRQADAAARDAARRDAERRDASAAPAPAAPAPAAPAAPAPAAPAAPAPAAGGILIPPVSGSLFVTSSYGYRVYPITGGWFMHNGVDLRSSCGSPQVAAAAGTVVGVRPAAGNGTHGNQVLVNHGILDGSSYVTVYNHLSRFAVRAGQQIPQGSVIGYTGATGNVTGCHVHFEVWKDGVTIDPMTLPGF
ncbi:peptidoglycan DD-metalloendopeptidase family protein [Georgenia sp. TF02-10]|uniref:M23 family metallopeptidase n=1 Tax=Georgenia sp. TF02-10 TaxID=2917725 RepID=UPI001FA6D415|nr:M23 family metallopeptidase [Georgenia sp. TF02-10]UNX54144.1 peptidoglycan DD-metalloendopeptidase family protein [Georgenia sp. TF02-10]